MQNSFQKLFVVVSSMSLLWALPVRSQDAAAAKASATASIDYLRRVMDQCHDRFVVYEDVSSPCNHFHMYARLGTATAQTAMNGSFPAGVAARGATVIKCTYSSTSPGDWGGFYFQNGVLPSGASAPMANWGTYPNAGINLTGAVRLTFWARGANGGEKIEFFLGGVGRDALSCTPVSTYPESACRNPSAGTITNLTSSWQMYSISLPASHNLSYVLAGFGWVASFANNPAGATFYLDDIQFELSSSAQATRLQQPRFLRSFTMRPVQPNIHDNTKSDDIDLVLRNCAYTYDNALALLAFLAGDSIQRAKLIGDAFVYAANHDRFFSDGRIRDAYSAGDIALPAGWKPNNRDFTVPAPGFYDDSLGAFFEVENTGLSVGNDAWVMISLLALHKRIPGDTTYLFAAKRIGQFIELFKNSSGLYQGYQGGLDSIETATPVKRTWASTEHNLDVYAAFRVMNNAVPNITWSTGFAHARTFVAAMNLSSGCYLTGTTNPNALNTNALQLPLDPQTWSVLAFFDSLAAYPQLPCAKQNHFCSHDGFRGFDFNTDTDGVWFEGTGQMACALAFAMQCDTARFYRGELRRAQQTSPFGDGQGIAASSHDSVSSGFGFSYFQRLHVGATSWNVFAQLGWNPYYQIIGPCLALGVSGPGSRPNIKVYPNPFRQSITIELPNGMNIKEGDNIQLLSLDGKKLYQFNLSNTDKPIVSLKNLAKLPPGVYCLKITLGLEVLTNMLVHQ